jgi:hypothetical protein
MDDGPGRRRADIRAARGEGNPPDRDVHRPIPAAASRDTIAIKPRKIGAHIDPPDPTTRLMQDPKQPAARLRTVNIHESVLQKIATADDGYAPIVLTGDYAIVADDGTVRPVSQPQREADQERVWDWVWHKRVCYYYFASLFVSLCLALFPVWHWVSHPAPCTGPACLLAPVISSAGAVLPGFAGPWIAAFAATPGWTVVFVAVLAWLLWRSGVLQDRIRSEMRALWERTLGLPAVTAPPPAWLPLRINHLRTSRSYQNFFQRLKWEWLPPAFGAPLLILLIVGGLTGIGIAAVRGGSGSPRPPACVPRPTDTRRDRSATR